MTVLDWAIIVGYLGFIVWLGARYARRQSNTTEYFLGGRQMPLWAVTLSVIAAEVSAATFLGVPAVAYSGNLAYVVFSLGFICGRLVLAVFFLGVYRRLELYTVYGFLDRRFGPPTKNAAAAVFLLGRLLASGVRLFVPAVAINMITGLDPYESVLIVGLLGLAYTFLGGIRGVIWTEVVQACTFIGGGIALVAFVVWKTDGGLTAAINVCANEDKFRVFDTSGSLWTEPYHVVTAFVGMTVLTLASHGTDQDMCQRMLTCKTTLASRLSVMYSGLLGLPVAVIFLLLGLALYAFVTLNDGTLGKLKPDEIFPAFVREHSVPGVPGLMLAALAAAALSTHASSIASMASTTIVDFYRPYIRRNADEAHYLWASRTASIFWGLALIGVACLSVEMHERGVTIIDLALGAMTLVYGPLLGVFLVGIFTPFGRNGSNLAGMLTGFLVVVFITTKNTLLEWAGLADQCEGLRAFHLAWPWWIVLGTLVTVTISMMGGRTPRAQVDNARAAGGA